MPRPLILLATNRRLVQAAALAAHVAGYRRQRWLMSQSDPEACRIYAPEVCQHLPHPELSTASPALRETLRAWARELPGAVVLPTCIHTSELCCRAPELLTEAGLTAFPVPPPEAFSALHDKATFAALLDELGVPQPRTQLVQSAADLDAALASDPTQAYFIKACAAEGGEGVERVENLPRAAAHIRGRLATEGRLLVQTAVPGEDVDISILAAHGQIVAHLCQRSLGSGGLDFAPIPGLLEGVERICAATGFHGLAHFDARRDPAGQVHFLECNPRVWNSIGKAAVAGVNFLELGLLAAQGQPLRAMRLRARDYVPHAWLRLTCSRQGIGPRRVTAALINQAGWGLRHPDLFWRVWRAHLQTSRRRRAEAQP